MQYIITIRKNLFICFFLLAIFFLPNSVLANYVLPYPSYMPGNKAYKISRIIDQLNYWWYFGNIAKIKYHLGLSDKYLVEAKTLFEYKQYLLGVDALKRSTKQFHTLPAYVKQGQSEGKDMASIIASISESAAIHSDVLLAMKDRSPETFRWVPEREAPTDLRLHNELDNGISAVLAVVEDVKR